MLNARAKFNNFFHVFMSFSYNCHYTGLILYFCKYL